MSSCSCFLPGDFHSIDVKVNADETAVNSWLFSQPTIGGTFEEGMGPGYCLKAFFWKCLHKMLQNGVSVLRGNLRDNTRALVKKCHIMETPL